MPLPDNHYKGTNIQHLVILVGDCRVGKTSYLNCIVNKKTSSSILQTIPPTIGVDYTPIRQRVRGQ